jgi:hypothetical protein
VMGIIVGTYSSVFIASPILVFWQDFIDSRKSARPASGGGGTSSGSGSSPVTKPAPGAKPGGPRAVTAAPNKETAGTRKAVRG